MATLAKTGSQTPIVVTKATTWGTAVQGGAGSRLVGFKVSPKAGKTALTPNAIGTGTDMYDHIDAGPEKPSITLSDGDERFDGPAQLIEATFFGGASVVAQASGTYCHSFIYNQTRDAAFVTIAVQGMNGSVIEHATCMPSKISTSVKVGDYVKKTIELLSSDEKITGTTNTAVTMAGTTAPTTKKAIAQKSDKFRINSGAWALSDLDVIPFLQADIEISDDIDHNIQIANSDLNGIPTRKGNPPFKGSLKITFAKQDTWKWREALDAGTEFKADIVITSSNYAGGTVPYSEAYRFPRLKLVTDIDWSVAEASDNPVTVTFEALAATSIPAGMCSKMPEKMIVNTTASYL